MSQDQKGTYVEVPQQEEPKTRLQEFKEFMSTNFKGYFLALLSAAFFCTGNIIMRKANEFGVKLSGFDHLVIFFAMTLLTLPPIVIYKKENLIGAPGKRGMLMIRALFQTFAVICLYNGLLILAPSDAAALGNTSIIFTAILSRIFMKEELGIPHVIAIVFTLIGVIFISKPAVIFGSKTVVAAVNQTIEAINSTVSQTADQGDKYFSAETWAIIGIVIIIMSAFFLGSVAAITKKTSNDNNHWSLVNLYVAYPGLPLNLMFSGIFYYFGFSKISDKGASIYITPVLLSCLSALIKLGGFTFSTMAFKYEDATKITLAKKLDLVLYFLLQAVILNISIDMYSVIGSVFLVGSNFILMGHKVWKAKTAKK